jgi:coenzyme F420 hydrogenase subunit beta
MVINPNNISQVTSSLPCCSCGACAGVCPKEAIRFQESIGGYYFPVVDEKICISCGLCMEVCPGIHFGNTIKSKIKHDPFQGNVLSSYVGKATNAKIYENSQSGGIVSALLVHALETKKITGAFTVTMEPGIPPKASATIATDIKEVILAQKSKYCPVPLLSFIKRLKNYNGQLAFVGTPCQIHGLNNCIDKFPELKKKIAFTIGLVCERILTYAAMDYLIRKALTQKKLDPPWMLHFKDKKASGYPGNVHVLTSDGNSVLIPAKTRKRIKDYFTPARCRLCFDKMNVFSDITVGDPHGLENIDREQGESIVIIRSATGNALVMDAISNESITVRPAQYAQILDGQGIRNKKEQWHEYSSAWEKSGRKLPDYYSIVKDKSFQVTEKPLYKKNIDLSLQLDKFSSRKKLIRFVEKSIGETWTSKIFSRISHSSKKIIKIFSFRRHSC